MPGFVREHMRPLVGSVGLHLLLIALIATVALRWTSSQPPVQLAIQGVVVDAKDVPKSTRSTAAPAAPPATRPPPTPTVDHQAQQRAADEAAARAMAEKERVERQRAQQQAVAAERRKQDQLAAERKQEAAEQAKREAAAEAERKKAAEDEARQKQAAQAQAALDAKAKAARAADLQKRLSAEEDESAALARSGVVDEYRAVLVQAIERNWIRPPSARPGLSCTLYVTQATGGTVMDVKVGPCNGDQAVRESIVNAVYRASPLPAPRDPRAFDRRLEIVFEPKE